jgi:catecholate siderophore receptor
MRKCSLELFEKAATGKRNSSSEFIRGKARAPATSAAIGFCSLMLGEGFAAAQQATTAASETVTLEQIDINGGGGSAYNPRESQITRLPTPILDTPQSITIIPQQVLEDQKTSTLVEALHNVPGISFLGGEGGTQGDNINIRGYSARNDFYRDGIRDPGWYVRDTFSVQEVEVLKGPSSFLFGRGSTGGVVNMTSKLPQFTNFTTFEGSAYTSPGGRGTVDVNRTWADVAGRIVLLGNDTTLAGRDFTKTKRIGVAPSLTMNMSPDTRVTVAYIFQKDNNVPDYGIPLLPGSYFGTKWGQPAPVARSTYYGVATPGFSDTEQVQVHIGTMKFVHDFNKDWQVTNVTRFSSVDRFVRVRGTQIGTQAPGSTANLYSSATGGAGSLLNPVPFAFPLSSLFVQNTNYFQNHTQNTLLTNQSDLVGHFDTWFMQHTFNAGIEADQETRDQFRTTFVTASGSTPIADRVNILDPNPYPLNYPQIPGTSTDQYDLGRTLGLYMGDQVKFNKYFEVMAGLRYDDLRVWQNYGNVNTYTGALTGLVNATTPYNIVNKVHYVSWRSGAIFHPVENSSLYFMYGTSFDPASEYLTITGNQQNFGPTTSETYELGGKYDMLDSKLSLTGALFKITQQNAIETINSAAGTYAAVGTTRVQGGEVGIAGKVTEQWSVFGGYTYMDGRVLKSAPSTTTGTGFVSQPGNKLQDVPRNTISLTSTYAIWPAFTVGGTAYYTSDRYTSSANVGRVPGYWRFDTMAAYKVTENFSMQVNILNLLDTKNFETLSGFGAAQPGTGRAAIISAKYTF